MNTEELQELYETDGVAKALCDHLRARQYNQTETRTTRILSLLNAENNGVRKSDLIKVLRKLEVLGCGTYVEGRRGWPSRFVWKVTSISTCSTAAGEVQDIESLKGVGDDDTEVDMLKHSFNLRADFAVDLALPIDISSSEAERLAAFIKTLPLEN